MTVCYLILAILSIWDYPSRFPMHVRLRRQFVAATREGDTSTMEETCRKGVKLLPDDPTWHYNLACSLAYFKGREAEALDELELAIDLGFRDRDAIAGDSDLKRLEGQERYGQLLEYADRMKTRPMLTGPMAAVSATGIFGKSIMLSEANLTWNFDVGCFTALMKMTTDPASVGGNVGDLYMNRDGLHSVLNVQDFPGITTVRLDEEGRRRNMDKGLPGILFPYPAFGNASQAWTQGPYWRSFSRGLLTTESGQLGKMVKFYLSNQVWVFPSNADTAPVGTNGDVFASIAPYWLTTAGKSWSDLPYLRAALEASRSFQPQVKAEIVRRGLLSPTIQTLIRKSLSGVTNEVDYLSERAHPTALPPNAADLTRLSISARAMTVEEIPPLAVVKVGMPEKVDSPESLPELTYASAFAWAFVLRAKQDERVFFIQAKGARDYAFVQTHGKGVDVKIEKVKPDLAKVTVRRQGLSPTNRVDIAVFGRNEKTGWGAPSYVCFSRVDPKAPYSDPALTLLPQPAAK